MSLLSWPSGNFGSLPQPVAFSFFLLSSLSHTDGSIFTLKSCLSHSLGFFSYWFLLAALLHLPSSKMDGQDMSQVHLYSQLMETQSQILVEAQKRKGKRPQLASRDELAMQYKFSRMMGERQSNLDHEMETIFMPSAYAPSVISFAYLTKIMINDLRLEIHHRGSFVLLKSIVPADCTSGAFCVVEDEEGNALTLIVYYQGQYRTAEDLLPQGGFFIVKEPYLTQLEDGNNGIRVDHATDISYLSMGNPLIPASWRQTSRDDRANAEEMKLKGNEYFLKGKYYAAIDRYESTKGKLNGGR